MKKKKNNRLKLLLVLLLVVSVGYALITTVLKVNGNARFARQSWNVYWANPQVTEGSKTLVKPTISDDGATSRNAKATWSVTFDLPGEFYEFTIDAVNAGSLDAKITGIDTTVTPELPDYISYTVTYANGREIREEQVLKAATEGVATVVTYKVRIEYLVDEIDAEAINNMEAVTLTYNLGITYGKTEAGPALKDVELTPEEMEEFIALVESNPDLYRNTEQAPENRDIGIDSYGNVINLDNFRTVPSLFQGHCLTYTNNGDSAQMGNESCGSAGLRWATASEFFEDGEWTLNFPAYIMFYDEYNPDEPGHFVPVTTLETFFKHYGYDVPENKKLRKIPHIPYTVTELKETFTYVGSLDGPITIPSTVTSIGTDTFMEAFRENADRTLRLYSGYPGYAEYFTDIDTIEFYD